jgi:hypothetical protein
VGLKYIRQTKKKRLSTEENNRIRGALSGPEAFTRYGVQISEDSSKTLRIDSVPGVCDFPVSYYM